jgi:hypothetical protein
MGKRIWKSKIVWTNIVALGLAVVQSQTGWVIPPETQGAVLTLINIILRGVTNEPVTWK